MEGSPRTYKLRVCPAGTHRVVATPTRESQCPADTDVIGTDADDRTVCLVALAAPHPGAPGAGGGLVRAGDCIPNIDVQGQVEVPCVAGTAFHKVVAVVADSKSCAAPAVRYLYWEPMLLSDANVLCLADADGIAGIGECVAYVGGEKAPTHVPVPCTNRPVLKLLGRTDGFEKCGRWNATMYVVRYDNLSSVLYECYRKFG
jgi:hypothetical protein